MTVALDTLSFPALGGTVRILTEGGDPDAAARARESVLDLHRRLTRFEADSELCRVNRDPRDRVPVGHLMLVFAAAAHWAGAMTGGLVDATLLDEVERAGYVESFDPDAAATWHAGPPSGQPKDGWLDIAVDVERSLLIRPPGLRLDSGGIGKGLAADLAAELLQRQPSWGIDCLGDLRVGGTNRLPRRIDVTSPDGDGSVIAVGSLIDGAVATSGTTRRSWGDRGEAHHLIDPRTGRPSDTDVVQVTAVAPTALEAEVRAKAALLSGAARAFEWLPDGGVVVGRDGRIETAEFDAAP
ncbi:MAG: FAD:protein FMN transferase [Solirubrobacterales bacterium]|nr:FAD:protein FMN transferase [Solirubrobacterales bacterium]